MLEKLRRCLPRWSHAAEARYEQFAALRRQIPLFLSLVLLNALVATASVWQSTPDHIVAGWLSSLLAAAAILFASRSRSAIRGTEGSVCRLTLGWIIGATLIGIAWGGGVWVIFPHLPMPLQFLMGILTITTTAAGAILLATAPLPMVSFVMPAVIPLFLRLAQWGDVGSAPLATAGTVFVATIVGAAWATFFVFVRNVNARLELEEKNLVIELLLKDFEDTSSDWLWQTDPELRMIHMSERGEAGIRVSIDSVIGKTIREMSRRDPDTDPEWRAHLEHLERHLPFHDFIYESHHDDGSVSWISVSGKPRFDRDGCFLGYRGVMSDISEKIIAEEARVQAEDKLLRSYAELETKVDERTQELRKNQESLRAAKEAAEAASHAKDVFIANISHELRTPLNAIIGFSELLANEQMGPLGGSEYTQFSTEINASGHHLLEIVNDILDLSKSHAGSLRIDHEPLDVGSVIDACTSIMAEEYAKKDVTLDMDLPARLPPVLGDRVRLRQILLNLLSNAIKFTEEGGAVRVAASVSGDDRLMIVISDTGIGMSSEELLVALEPFGQIDTSLSRRHAGTGLGLPLTKNLIELHGGEMRIDSTLGQGTTVTIVLPLSGSLEDLAEADAASPTWIAETGS